MPCCEETAQGISGCTKVPQESPHQSRRARFLFVSPGQAKHPKRSMQSLDLKGQRPHLATNKSGRFASWFSLQTPQGSPLQPSLFFPRTFKSFILLIERATSEMLKGVKASGHRL